MKSSRSLKFMSRIIDIASMVIMKMNISLMDWEEVMNLGDCVLFLGRETTASCLESDLGLSRGCIYYTQSDDRNVYRFDPEKGTIIVTLPCPNLPRPWFSPEWLILLPPSLGAVDERNIRNTSSCREVEDMNTGQNENKILKSRSDEEEEDLEEMENFPIILSKEMLEIIEAYLHPMDYMRLRSTSKAAHSLMHKPNWQYADIRQDTSLYPLLFFLTKYDGVFNFVDPMSEKYLMNLSEFSDSDIHYSKDGWLLMSDGESIVLLNPFAGRRVFLPNLPTEGGDYVNFGYDFKGISFSSSPTSPDCIVFAIEGWTKHSVVIHYTKRGDDHWGHGVVNSSGLPTNDRKSMGFKPRRLVPVFYDGRFYCLDSKGALATLYLENGAHWRVLEKPKRPCNTIYQCFLVECDGNLLPVFVGHMGKWVRIFRLDFSAIAWVEVENLGKHMLFISYTSCVSAVAPVSRMASKVYFPRYNNGEGVVYYSLDTGLYHSFGDQQQPSLQDFYNTKEQLYSGWLEPNCSQNTHMMNLPGRYLSSGVIRSLIACWDSQANDH